MKEYRTTGIINITGGLIGLTEKQAAKRAHLLKETKKKGVFEIMGIVTFKAGEVISLDDVSKAQESLLAETSAENKAKADADAKAKAEAEAKAKAEADAKAKAEKDADKK